MGALDGKVAIITGAGTGVGRCHAELFAAEGASVVVNDVSDAAVEVADAITAAGGTAVAHQSDISDWDATGAMVKRTLDEFGDLDVVVNNAGLLRDSMSFSMAEDQWNIVVDVHLRGSYLVAKAAWDQFVEQGTGGRIINTSSTSGLIGNFGQANYGAAKAGIAGMTRVLALEGMKYGITVNTLAPAAFSRMTEDIMPDGQEERLAPEKVSPPVVWLCTDDAKDVTGRQFTVGGNRVNLLSWQVTEIASKDPMSEPFTVAEIGDHMRASMENWPRLLKPMEV